LPLKYIKAINAAALKHPIIIFRRKNLTKEVYRYLSKLFNMFRFMRKDIIKAA